MFPKDKPSIKVKGDLIDVNHGRRFPLYKNFIAIGITVFIVIIMLLPSDSNAYTVVIPICLLVLLIMITSTVGLNISLKEGKYQYYFGVFGIRVGKWKKYSNFSCLVLKSSLKKRERFLTHHEIEVNTGSEVFKTTELYLMNSSHRKKLLCGSFGTYPEAKVFAKELSEILNYPIQKFRQKELNEEDRLKEHSYHNGCK